VPQAHPDRNIKLLFVYWFLRDFQLWIPVWIVFLTLERGFSLTQVTLAEGIFLVGVLVLEVPTGAIADRYGRSGSMALGALVLGASVLIFAFTTSFTILLVSFLLWSVASALMSGADSALLFETLKAANREREYERLAGRGVALAWAGVGMATFLGGPVASLFDIRTTIYIGAGTCLLTAATAISIWEPPHVRSERREQSYVGSIGAAFKEAWQAVDVRILLLLAGSSLAALESVHYLVQPYLLKSGVEVGVWFSSLQVPLLLAGIVGALAADRLSSRSGSVRLLVVGPIAGAVCFAVLAAHPELGAYAALPVITGIGSCLEPVAAGYLNRRISSERRATVLSIQNMLRSLVMAVLAPTLGFATDEWGLGQAFAICAAMTLVAAVVFGIPLALRARGAGLEAGSVAESSAAG